MVFPSFYDDVITWPKKGGSGSKLAGDFFLVKVDYNYDLKNLVCNLF